MSSDPQNDVHGTIDPQGGDAPGRSRDNRRLHLIALGQALIEHDLREHPYPDLSLVSERLRGADAVFSNLETTLRPEGTAACVRAVIEHNLLYGGPQRLWYWGPMFRHERPQKGRFRQFHQVGVEALGFPGPDVDAEHLVIEDWALYPWKAQELAWDKCRTARGIGALSYICDAAGVPYTLQPAKIKDQAVAAGAEAYFKKPLHENRHLHDSIMHAVYFQVTNGVGV